MIWKLFLVFLKIGLFTFGGGYAMIPIIESEVVERHSWIEKELFYDLLTLAQAAPGPISLNTAVFVGYRMCGWKGAVASLLGVILPSFLIVLVIAIFFSSVRNNSVVDAALRGMRPAVVALMVAPVLGFTKGMKWSLIAVVVVTIMLFFLHFSPVYILLLSAVAGAAFALIKRKEDKK
ncbi:MAG: chromate transporter [Alistipes sp.]|nr:chromate transporter [Candidatus Alistipes equi]